MGRNENSTGKRHAKQGGSERKKSKVRENSSGNKPEKARKPTSNKNIPIKRKALKDDTEGIRLNKYVANSGMCSRRDADIYIAAGNVTVNGKPVTEMGHRVQLTDEVKFDGRRINPEKPEYVLLNKPKGFFVTGSLERNNRTVMDLVANASKAKLSPVGKLDTQSTGLLLFTNDGALAKNLAHPKNGIRQIYHLELDKELHFDDLKRIKEGITLEDGIVKVTDISYVENRPKREVGIELKSTRNHVVQRLFKSLNYEIVKLDRVIYADLSKKDIPRGHWRVLTKQEIINLRNV